MTKPTPGVLESTRPVLEAARHVRLDQGRLEELCEGWARQPFEVPPWNAEVHWSDGGPRAANYLLLLDALNFCFWPDPGQTRWEIDFRGRRLGGYMALAASLKRAVEEGVPILEAGWMAEVRAEDLERVFRGHGRIPLMERRVAHVREAGRGLLARWGGQFAQAIESVQGSAVALVELLAREFPSFEDVATYPLEPGGPASHPVRFYKRAQIAVGDLHATFAGQGLGRFHDMGALTAFADYKIPQALHAFGVLRYTPELEDRLRRLEELAPGSEEEVEIRAAMVWAVEELRLELERRGIRRTPFELDWFLWNLGQAPLPGQLPYHRTRTGYY